MLVFGRVHVGAQLVGRRPERFFDIVEHAVAFFRVGFILF